MKAAVVGLGKLGLPCAEVMTMEHDVTGYDVRPVVSDSVRVCPTLEEAVRDREFVFVAVQTPHDPLYGGEKPTSHLPPRDFDYQHLKSVVALIDAYVSPGTTIVVISTVLPGTMRREIAPMVRNAKLLYNPYLIAMGTVKEDMMEPEMVIMGSDTGDIDDFVRLSDFYRPLMHGVTRFEVGTWEEAESIKIFYNTFISAKIALVNMVQDVAERIGHMNAETVSRALARSKKRIMGPGYMVPGMGDAGACHPRDNIALRHLASRLDLGYDLFEAIMQSREAQARNMAEALLRYGQEIVIVGKAYKPGVDLTDGSSSLLVGHYIEELGGTVTYYDQNTGDLTLPGRPVVYLIAYWDRWTMRVPYHAGSTVVDPWRNFPVDRDDITVIHYGDTTRR